MKKTGLFKKLLAVSTSAVIISGCTFAALPVPAVGAISMTDVPYTPEDDTKISYRFHYVGGPTDGKANVVIDGIESIYGGEPNVNYLTLPVYVGSMRIVGYSDEAFAGLDSLRTVTFERYSASDMTLFKRYGLGKGLFKNCRYLRTVDFGNIDMKTIPDETFMGCRALLDYEADDYPTTIGKYAFSGCRLLANIDNMISHAKTIDEGAFMGDTFLEKVTISTATKTIGKDAFRDCSGLDKMTIESKTVSISENAIGVSDDFVKPYFYIQGYEDSTAQEYCEKTGVDFATPYMTFVQPSASSYTVKAGETVTIRGGNSLKTSLDFYTYYYKRANAKNWTVLGTENTSDKTVTFRSKTPGAFNIKVEIRASNGALRCTGTFNIDVNSEEALENNSYLEADEITANTKAVINAEAAGGTGVYTYDYSYRRKGSRKWVTLATGTTAKTASFTPRSGGEFEVLVRVNNGLNNEDGGNEKILNLTVYDLYVK